jgi:hypothetical protein
MHSSVPHLLCHPLSCPCLFGALKLALSLSTRTHPLCLALLALSCYSRAPSPLLATEAPPLLPTTPSLLLLACACHCCTATRDPLRHRRAPRAARVAQHRAATMAVMGSCGQLATGRRGANRGHQQVRGGLLVLCRHPIAAGELPNG